MEALIGHLPRTHTQLYSEMGTITNGIFISNQSLDIITKTGNYRGANISELKSYITPSSWCGIKAYVQSDNAAFFHIVTSDNIVICAYRDGDGTYKIYPLALKSDLSIKYKDFYVKLSESNWVTSATGLNYFDFPVDIPDKGIVISTEILKWSNTKSNVTCSFYDNSYLQFRSSDRTTWDGTVRVFYQ